MKRTDLIVGEHYAVTPNRDWKASASALRRAVVLDPRPRRIISRLSTEVRAPECFTLSDGQVVDASRYPLIKPGERWRDEGVLVVWVQKDDGEPSSISLIAVLPPLQIRAPWADALVAVEEAGQVRQAANLEKSQEREQRRAESDHRMARLEAALGHKPETAVIRGWEVESRFAAADVDALLAIIEEARR